MRFNFKLFFRLIYITLFDSKQYGVEITPRRLLILVVFLFVLTPIFLGTAYVGWVLDDILFPKYRNQEVREPVFIIGNPRSGTTFLHRLMARDEHNFYHFRAWELGFAPTITQRRFFQYLGKVDALIGGPLRALTEYVNEHLLGSIDKHPTSLYEAEEDDLILLYVWNSMFILGVFPYPDVILPPILDFDHLAEERQRVMPFYKNCLRRHQYIRQKHDNQCYLSKNPVFCSRIDALYETFPDAKFVYLVRNPVDMVGSLSSYARTVWEDFQGAGRTFPHDDHIWTVVRKWYKYTLERLEQAPRESYIIVRFNDLTHNPRRTVTRIYEHFGFAIDGAFDEVLLEASEKARRYTSTHSYSLQGTTITCQRILDEFGDLIKRFDFDADEPA